MVDAITAETPSAASPATEEAAQDAAALSRLAGLAEALATGFQAQGLAALQAGDLDRAGEVETRFSNLFLGIRRAIALRIKLREQREEAQHEVEDDRDRRQDEKDDRRHVVPERMSRAIAAGKPEARERLTTELWERLTEDERIDADLAHTALPIEALIRRLARDIGLSRRALAAALDPAMAKADPAAAGPKPWDKAPGPAAASPPPRDPSRPSLVVVRSVEASDFGEPEGEHWIHDVTTGKVSDTSGKVVRILPIPEKPWQVGPSGLEPPGWAAAARIPPAEDAAPPTPDPQPPPAATAPPSERPLPSDRRSWTQADWDEDRRRTREAQLKLYAPKPPSS